MFYYFYYCQPVSNLQQNLQNMRCFLKCAQKNRLIENVLLSTHNIFPLVEKKMEKKDIQI